MFNLQAILSNGAIDSWKINDISGIWLRQGRHRASINAGKRFNQKKFSPRSTLHHQVNTNTFALNSTVIIFF